MPHPSHPRGFTLIEMLLVVAIIGILVTLLAPRMQMMGGPRVTAAARVLTQMTRYARTMALLHQAETVLSVTADGLIRVGAGGAAAAPDPSRSLQDEPLPGDPRFHAADRGMLSGDGGAPSPPPAFAEAVAVERRVEQVTIRFLGYTDTLAELQADGAPLAEDGSEVRFRSNGTCRPHRYALTDTSGVEATVTVDLLGLARVDTGKERR